MFPESVPEFSHTIHNKYMPAHTILWVIKIMELRKNSTIGNW